MYRVRGRILLLQMALAAALTALVLYALVPAVAGRDVPAQLDFIAFMGLWYVFVLALVEPIRRRATTSWATLFGPPPTLRVVGWSVLTAVGLIGVSLASIALVFVPLSYVAPEFVSAWLFDDMPQYIRLSGDYWLLGTLGAVITIAVLAPFTEELLFRGLLLPAWMTRMGRPGGIAMTSLAFAVLHADVLGGIIFAVVMAEVFLRTGTLWAPVLIHMANNALAVAAEIVVIAITGAPEPATVAHLQETWWSGLIGFVVGTPLLIAMLRRLPEATTASATLAHADVSASPSVAG